MVKASTAWQWKGWSPAVTCWLTLSLPAAVELCPAVEGLLEWTRIISLLLAAGTRRSDTVGASFYMESTALSGPVVAFNGDATSRNGGGLPLGVLNRLMLSWGVGYEGLLVMWSLLCSCVPYIICIVHIHLQYTFFFRAILFDCELKNANTTLTPFIRREKKEANHGTQFFIILDLFFCRIISNQIAVYKLDHCACYIYSFLVIVFQVEVSRSLVYLTMRRMKFFASFML